VLAKSGSAAQGSKLGALSAVLVAKRHAILTCRASPRW